jgi:Flp pilus assembly protein TadG
VIGGHHNQTGATSTELVIVFPVVLLVILLALQFGLYLHAAQIAEAGAQEAVEAAQGERADARDGQAAASRLLRSLGALRAPDVAVDRTATAVTARVSGHAQQLVPGFSLRIWATAEGPVERFVPETAP